MDFHEKLQYLRKQRGLTQEELANLLFVSRTAISKWESGKGYPNIDSLKAISRCFCVTIDELLSGEELLTLAEENAAQKNTHTCDLLFGLLDCSIAMFFFLPVFGQVSDRIVENLPLLLLTSVQPYLKRFYLIAVSSTVLCGILTLALQNCTLLFWKKHHHSISLLCNTACVLLYIVSRQPYAAALSFVYLVIKSLFCLKSR